MIPNQKQIALNEKFASHLKIFLKKGSERDLDFNESFFK